MQLIDADALTDKAWDAENGFGWEKVISIKDVMDAPTIDAISVVRCGDCKYHMDIDNGRQKHYMCGQVGCDDWFCADAEPKEEEEEGEEDD